MLSVRGTQTAIRFFLKQRLEEEAFDSLAGGWLLLAKALSLRPQPSASASPHAAKGRVWVLSFDHSFLLIVVCISKIVT